VRRPKFYGLTTSDSVLYEQIARDACTGLAEKLRHAQGKPVTPKEFATALTEALRAADLELADLATSRLRRLAPAAGKRRITDGTWPIVAHDDDLLAHFPANPEIYHKPNAWPGIIDTGEHGAAETADGTMRLIDAAEAETVGLHDGTYRQTRTAQHLEQRLTDGTDG